VRWPFQEARQRFDELIRRTELDGPQIVTRHGRDVVVVLAAEEHERRRDGTRDFKALLMSAPSLDALDIRRDPMPARTIELPAIASDT
jgi:prevent-host-death family protein